MDGSRHDQGGAEYRSGTPIVDGGELRTVDAATAAREVRAARLRLVGPELS